MTELVIAVIGVIVAVALFVWMIWLPKKRGKDPAQLMWIMTTLESIRVEADRKRLHLHATPKIDVGEAFAELRRMLADHPAELRARIEALEHRWQELNAQIGEFRAADTGTTLQNSVIATRTSKLANDIGDLIEEIRAELGPSRSE